MAWLLPLGIAAVVWAAASRRVPAWAPWLLPVGAAVFFYFAWHGESTWTRGGDPQPGLVALVGVVSVAALVAGILVGYLLRARQYRRGGQGGTAHRPDV